MSSSPIEGIRPVQSASAEPVARMAPRVAHEVDKLTPMQEFESFTLRSFVEAMLPSEASNFFGSGTAGNIWRSMMAEQIGEQIARAGGIGIAETIAKDRGIETDAAGEIRTQQGQSARMRFDAVLASTTMP
ncbi:rod-binding protein [Fulvimarina sp. MAC3]|uniref:rod-binding protein n=1 Tax=Fulvimarina sp. MAC3 TaxID=3148887 RepID=UPI0031FE2C08